MMRLFIPLWLALCLTVTVHTQSLRDRAKREGGRAVNDISFTLPITTIPELLSQSDLVMRACIVEARSHLAPDESHVVTDYVAAPILMIKQKRPLATSRPGETTEIVVRLAGGRLVENGLEMITTVNLYSESESFKVGEEVVVFLDYDTDARVYILTGGPFGAFRLQDGRVRAMTQKASERRGDTPKDVTTFVDELVRASR